MTGHADVDQAGPAETQRPKSAQLGLMMLGGVASVASVAGVAGDSATTDGHCDDGYCAVP